MVADYDDNDCRRKLDIFLKQNAANIDDVSAREELFNIIAMAYKCQLSSEDMNLLIHITNKDFPYNVNGYFEAVRKRFNEIDKKDFDEKSETMRLFVEAAKELFGGLTMNMTNKNKKKNVSRIIAEVNKWCKIDRFRTNRDQQVIKDLKAFQTAFVEVLIRIRENLSKKQYDQIPDGLTIRTDSKTVPVKNLFLYNEKLSRYDRVDNLSKPLARELQMLIAVYIIKCKDE